MGLLFSLLLFRSSQLINAFVAAGFLLLCAKKKKKPDGKNHALPLQNSPAAYGTAVSNQNDALPRESKPHEPLKNINNNDEPDSKQQGNNKSNKVKGDQSEKKAGKKEDQDKKLVESRDKWEENKEKSEKKNQAAGGSNKSKKGKSEKKIEGADKSNKSKNDKSSKKSLNEDETDDDESTCTSDTENESKSKKKDIDEKSVKKKEVVNNENKSKSFVKEKLNEEEICIEPLELHFKKEKKKNELQLHNRTGKRVAMMVRPGASNMKNFHYWPKYSFIERDSTRKMIITRTKSLSEDGEMVLYFYEAPPDANDIYDFWKTIPKDGSIMVLVKCVAMIID